MPATSVSYPTHGSRVALTHVCGAELTEEDISAIDNAGAFGARRSTVRTFVNRAVGLALVGAAFLGVCSYFGIDIL